VHCIYNDFTDESNKALWMKTDQEPVTDESKRRK